LNNSSPRLSAPVSHPQQEPGHALRHQCGRAARPAAAAHLEEAPGGPERDRHQRRPPAWALVHQESLHGLLQQAFLESLHNRAATLVFASSFASSLLGSRALADGLGACDRLAVILLLAVGALTVAPLPPLVPV
jgi:hypothetical protein